MNKRLLAITIAAICAIMCTVLAICVFAAEDVVYFDATGQKEGAYTDLSKAISSLTKGGKVVICSDVTFGTTSAGGTFPNAGGKLTVTSQNGAKLKMARVIYLSNETVFENITIVNTHSSRGNIICKGNNVTMGENVVCETTVNRYPTIYGGNASGTVTADTHIVVKSGTYHCIFGGNSIGAFNGDTLVEVYGATVLTRVKAQSEGGTFNGTSAVKLYSGAKTAIVQGDSITVDLTALGSVTATSYSVTPSVIVPDGYEAVTSDGLTYTAQKINTEPAPTLVYADGIGEAENTFKDLASAAAALRDGGTIVVSGKVKVNSSATLSAKGHILVTSVYGDEDYTDTAALEIANDIVLGTDVTFKDITLDKVATGNDYIVAKGHKLVIDEGVYCRNNLATNNISIVGGAMSGTFTGNSDITVKSGFFRNIFGGNYNGTFKGNSTVNFLGGYVDNMVAGGTFMGNFEGDTTVNVGGDAVLVYTETGSGLNGGNCGSGSDSYTFVGDIRINIFGSARINQSVYGTTRYSNVTTTGNVEITVSDDAFIYQNLYAGGYAGTLNGSTKVTVNDGWVGVNLSAGNRSGTVNGDTYLEVNGGQINYYYTNMHSSYSHAPGKYNVGGGGLTGKVNGNTTVVINGGDIYGNVYGGAITTGTVSGNSTVTITGGSIMCGAYADGCTAGSVAGTKTLNVDLSKGGALALGLSADVNTLTGGGSVSLFPEATLKVGTLIGNVALSINGVPQAKDYIVADNYGGASVTYTPVGGETFASGSGRYGISSEGYYPTTRVKFKHLDGVSIIMRATIVKDSAKLPATSTSATESIFDLAPGIYNYVVYHTQEDYTRKYLYVTGKEEEIVLDFTSYTPMQGEGFEGLHNAENTEEIYDKFYNTDDLVGYETPDSPYFNNDRSDKRLFTSNEEMNAFIKEKVASSKYAYSYDLFTSSGGTTVPIVVFTKDAIPTNATLNEAAKLITSKKGRDILMVTAQVHGNEPSSGEGALALISELCGEYGNDLLTGNVGAVIVIPRLNPDGSERFTRGTPDTTVESNLNRDYAILTSAEISGVVRAFDLFAPTLLVDWHEAPLDPQWGQSLTLSDIYDVGIMSAGTLNTPFVDASAVIKGDYQDRGMRPLEYITEALKEIEKTGLRPYYYQTPMTFPANNSPYGLTNGAYSFLVEVPGINAGDAVFERRVFAGVTAIKELFALAAESDGAMAREVYAAREKTALSAQKFDVNTPIVLQHTYTRHDSSTLLWNNPLAAADATIRKADNITKYYVQDVALKYRARPTAYVVSASASGIDKVLSVLDKQGIGYFLLDEGVTLNLKRYGGNSTTATLGAAADVTFADGAYIIPVDGYKAYLIATLFEPENPDSGEYTTTFAEAGYLAATDIYRSEESYIAAKLGLAGTYIEIPTCGKAVYSATVNGVAYYNVDTEGNNAYIVASDAEYYTVTLSYTDGTSETVHIGKLRGDIDEDHSISNADITLAVRYLSGWNISYDANFDVTRDGILNNRDIIALIKIIASNVE